MTSRALPPRSLYCSRVKFNFDSIPGRNRKRMPTPRYISAQNRLLQRFLALSRIIWGVGTFLVYRRKETVSTRVFYPIVVNISASVNTLRILSQQHEFKKVEPVSAQQQQPCRCPPPPLLRCSHTSSPATRTARTSSCPFTSATRV